jgi:hypothetical protein
MNALALEDGMETIRKAIEAARETYAVQMFGITGCMEARTR